MLGHLVWGLLLRVIAFGYLLDQLLGLCVCWWSVGVRRGVMLVLEV